MIIIGIRIFYIFFAISQAADELREQEVQQKTEEIQQRSAQLEQTQVLNSVLMHVGCVPLPILSLFLAQQDYNMHDWIFHKMTFCGY